MCKVSFFYVDKKRERQLLYEVSLSVSFLNTGFGEADEIVEGELLGAGGGGDTRRL